MLCIGEEKNEWKVIIGTFAHHCRDVIKEHPSYTPIIFTQLKAMEAEYAERYSERKARIQRLGNTQQLVPPKKCMHFIDKKVCSQPISCNY
mmetsp:Transcript_3712/g.4806  ORF Transcript_3712/g.4806 Transcript_3712/m.4806 type:complete len:91 (-) Transcript_3712:29-301(-)